MVLRPTATPQAGGIDNLCSNLLVGKNRQMLDETNQVIIGPLDPLHRTLLPGACRAKTSTWTTMTKFATTSKPTKASVTPREAD
jgi:hypothetical protein